MNSRSRFFLGLLLALATVIIAIGLTHRQPPGQASGSLRVAIFSYVSHPVLDTVKNSFEAHLAGLAAAQGRSISFERYNADGVDSQLAPISAEIIKSRPVLAVSIATPVSRQLVLDAPAEFPIIYSFVTNPDSLGQARFTKNVTGVSDAVNYPANVALFVDTVPGVKSVGMLYNPAEPNSLDALERVRPLLASRSIKLVTAEVSTAAQVPSSAEAIASQVDLFYIGGDNTVVGAAASLVDVGRRTGKPVFASDSGSVGAGAAAAISVDYRVIGSTTAELASAILFGGKQPRAITPQSVPGATLATNSKALEAWHVAIPPQYRSQLRLVDGGPAEAP